jgi:hypothetical protein
MTIPKTFLRCRNIWINVEEIQSLAIMPPHSTFGGLAASPQVVLWIFLRDDHTRSIDFNTWQEAEDFTKTLFEKMGATEIWIAVPNVDPAPEESHDHRN